jgi:uncharacterized membrane protein YbhN (UPF0104 family)
VDVRDAEPEREELTISDAAPPTTLQPVSAPRRRRGVRVLIWLAAVALLLLVLEAAGVGIWSWLQSLWDTITEISAGYILAAFVLQTVQTSLAALSWYGILRAGYPDSGLRYRTMLAAYAVSVALNGVLPASLGTLVLLFMLVVLIPGSTFPGILGAFMVQKIFFTVIGGVVYAYLFISVEGSFSLEFGNVADNPVLWIAIVVGAVALIALLVRIFWQRMKKLWEEAKQGGAILARPRRYVIDVLLPSMGSWVAKVAVIAVFLAAYSIPVNLHTLMTIVGGNSLADVTSFTPGGIGVNQAINTASLARNGVDATTAAAYSTAQQLITTAWNIGFAIVLVAVVFGWQGGKVLVGTSYTEAKAKSGEMKEERKQQRAAKRAARRAARDGDDDAGGPLPPAASG